MHFTTTSCLGCGPDAVLDTLRGQRGGLVLCTLSYTDLGTWVDEVPGADTAPVHADLTDFDCRNDRLAQIGLAQDGSTESAEAAKTRHGAGRVGVFIGASTSGILEAERTYQQHDSQTGTLPASFHCAQTHNIYSPAAFVHMYFGLSRPATAISPACSSGVKVFASARRMLAAGLIGTAVVGGVDSLCLTALYGFNSLELPLWQLYRPYNVARDDIPIGEAIAFASLERAPETNDALDDGAILLFDIGKSSDAHHVLSPHPEGLGVRATMAQALATSNLSMVDTDYINLHSTGTPSNDVAEPRIVQVLSHGTAYSSTKGATGHTLGAAGASETVITALALRHQLLSAGINTIQPNPVLIANCLTENSHARIRTALSNAFGFGGVNCSLVLGRADHLGLSS